MTTLFADPGNRFRHLAIIHHFSTAHRHQWETGTGPNAGPMDYAARAERHLTRLAGMGFGGVVANVGPQRYLEDEEEWRAFLAGFEVAKKMGLRFWIYDEDGYPSGAAGGLVLRDHPEYQAQALVRMEDGFAPGQIVMRPPSGWLYAVRAEVRHKGSQSAEDVTSSVGEDGWLRFEADRACRVTRFDARRAFEGTHCANNVHSVRRYINVLSEKAVGHFYDVTEEAYFARMGADAGRVEAVFTDEPSFMAAYFGTLPYGLAERVRVQDQPAAQWDRLPMIAWDDALPARFQARWGYDLLPELGRLFDGVDLRDCRVRHDFYQVQSEVYARTFFGLQQERLARRGIAFSGHVLAEEAMVHHVATEGDVMACLKHMHLPGIDMLNSIGEEILDSPRLLTCKYASSAAHLVGREQVMSEASQWEQQMAGIEVDAAARRGAVAVQMALGVTTITSYYGWKDWPTEDVRSLLDFWARLAVILRHGAHIADIAVLYPIRTAWSCYRPTSEVLTNASQNEPLASMDGCLHRIARAILSAGLDFDFIDSRSLTDAAPSEPGRLRVAGESYGMLIIPPGATMCREEIESMGRFVARGGHVLAFEPLCDWALETDCERSVADAVVSLQSTASDRVRHVSIDSEWMESALTAASRDVRVKPGGPYVLARRSVYDDTDFVLVVNGGSQAARADVAFNPVRTVELWDPATGECSAAGSNPVQLRLDGCSAVVVVSRRTEP